VREFYNLSFLCEQTDEHVTLVPGIEVSDANFFSLSDLPYLSTRRQDLDDIENTFAASANKLTKVLFD